MHKFKSITRTADIEVDVPNKKEKDVVIKSETDDDSTFNELIEDDARDVITSSVKKKSEYEIPLSSLHFLPNVSSSHVEGHGSSTGGPPESSGKVKCAKRFPESSEKVKGYNCSAKELGKSSRKIRKPSSQTQNLRRLNLDRISADISGEKGIQCSERARMHFGSTITDVPVVREEGIYNSTQTPSRNTRRRQRKKTNTKNRHVVTIPSHELDSQESVNIKLEEDDFSCGRETGNINAKESMVDVTWVSEGILCSKKDLDVDCYVQHTGGFANNEERKDPTSLNFIPDSQNMEQKITDPSPGEQKGHSRTKAKKKSASRKCVNKKKQRNSDVENGSKQKHMTLIDSESHKKCNKTKPDSTVGGINIAPIHSPKKEVGSQSKSRSNRNRNEVTTKSSYRIEVQSESISTLLDEEKPKRKLRPKVYHCEYCPSTFSRMDYLKLHLMHHTNERPFKCDVCAKGFRMRWRVKLHRATHFEDKPHRCKFCSYRTIRRDALLSHTKRMHKNVVVCGMKNCLVDHFH